MFYKTCNRQTGSYLNSRKEPESSIEVKIKLLHSIFTIKNLNQCLFRKNFTDKYQYYNGI